MSKRVDYSKLLTEQTNPLSGRIDQLSPLQILQLMNREDAKVASAVAKALPLMAKAVTIIVSAIERGGRIFFIGAGTSGRLGVMEAAECPPTFNTPPQLVQAIMAGGRSSVFRSKEGAEDKGQDARSAIQGKVRPGDVVVGIAASGVTPFVGEGLRQAKKMKAKTILVTCNPSMKGVADVVISIKTGPEVIAGSTRLKAATATKLVLNSLTVASMVRLGKVYRNWMVDLQPRSRKLRERALRLISRLGNVPRARAEKLFAEARGRTKPAIVMARKKISHGEAARRLKRAGGHLHKALDERSGD